MHHHLQALAMNEHRCKQIGAEAKRKEQKRQHIWASMRSQMLYQAAQCARVTDVCIVSMYRRSAQDTRKGSQGVAVFLSVCLQDLVESVTTTENKDEWQHG